MKRVILASASPRRRELLANLIPEFEIMPADTEEILPCGSPEEIVCALSREKAEWIARRQQGAWVIGADTMVFCDGKALGKPRDPAEAEKMLRMLSGRGHQVCTGVTVISERGTRTAAESTDVYFAPLTESELAAYLATGDSLDKAGAYGIQGYAARYIEKIDGDYFNVVGLPLHLTYRLLRELGYPFE